MATSAPELHDDDQPVFLRSFSESLWRHFRGVVLRSGTEVKDTAQQVESDADNSSSLAGWRSGLLASTTIVGLFVLTELALLTLGSVLYPPVSGVGTIFVGSCRQVKDLSTYILIPLNIVGTMAIACGNYVMQTLNAPTRPDIDRAHRRGYPLNIGVSSLNNMRHVGLRKNMMYFLLGLATIPIHLLLNSVLFISLQANDYGVMIASEDFLQDGSWESSRMQVNNTLASGFVYRLRDTILQNSSQVSYLDAEHCMSAYSNGIQSKNSALVLVTSKTSDHWANIPRPDINVTVSPTFKNGSCFTTLSQFPMKGTIHFDTTCKGKNGHKWDSATSSRPGTGLYLDSTDPLWGIDSLRGVFNAFDYKYWAIAESNKYNFSNSRAAFGNQWEPGAWLCDWNHTISGKQCSLSTVKQDDNNWRVTPKDFAVERCISTVTQEACQLQYSMIVLALIFAGELMKLLILRFALETLNTETAPPLATIGDAIASFLTSHDRSGVGARCSIDCSDDRNIGTVATRSWINKSQNMYYMRWLLPHRAQRHLCEPIDVVEESSEDKPVSLGAYIFPTPEDRDKRKGTTEQSKQECAARKEMWPAVYNPTPFPWAPRKSRWYHVPSMTRWVSLAFLFVAFLSLAIVILALGIENLQGLGLSSNWDHGLGTVDPNAVFTSTNTSGDGGGLMKDIIIVNLPQLLLSILYFQYNGLFTSMLAGCEWTRFGNRRKLLRVSKPTQQQRSTYWLSLPWRYSLPLMGLSATMHWLLSRSLFLVRILVHDFNNEPEPKRNISACGYSPLAILLVIIMLILMIGIVVAFGFRRLPTVSPMVAPMSWAISAACHDDDPGAAWKPVKWGVAGITSPCGVGRLCLSSKEVELPAEGHLYV